MKKYITFLFAFLFLFGCTNMMKDIAGVKKTSYTSIEQPFQIEATRNYLPKDMVSPGYTIYEGSKWDCGYKTEALDDICCLASAQTAFNNWKYCVLVKNEKEGFAFFELGNGEFVSWSEGPQNIFNKITP